MTILVKIHSQTPKGKINEWAVVELQGDLKPIRSTNFSRECFGNLHYNKYGVPTIVIGHHILQGREETLEKPFAVLNKSGGDAEDAVLYENMKNGDISINNNTLLDKTIAVENKIQQRTQYLIEAICTKKLIFKLRPKPIIMNVPKKH